MRKTDDMVSVSRRALAKLRAEAGIARRELTEAEHELDDLIRGPGRIEPRQLRQPFERVKRILRIVAKLEDAHEKLSGSPRPEKRGAFSRDTIDPRGPKGGGR
jgi:hypothetical protein